MTRTATRSTCDAPPPVAQVRQAQAARWQSSTRPAPPAPPPAPAIPAELAARIQAARAEATKSALAADQVWAVIRAAAIAQRPADAVGPLYVMTDDAGPEVQKRLRVAQEAETRARVRLNALEREAQHHRDTDGLPPAPPRRGPDPSAGRDRVTLIARVDVP